MRIILAGTCHWANASYWGDQSERQAQVKRRQRPLMDIVFVYPVNTAMQTPELRNQGLSEAQPCSSLVPPRMYVVLAASRLITLCT